MHQKLAKNTEAARANTEASCAAYSSCACVRQYVTESIMMMKECATYAEVMVRVSLLVEVTAE